MKVLIGVDGSAGGFTAVRLAGQLLSPDADQVALYYTPPDMRLRGDSDPGPQMIERAQQALSNAVFEEALGYLPTGLSENARTIVGTRNPRQGIPAAAQEWQADMIAMGARGSGPIQKLLLGSVVDAVVHASTIPVLVARPTAGLADDRPISVMLAWDGSPGSRQAAQLLGKFTWQPGAVGRVVTVVESLLVAEVPEWLELRARSADSEAMAQAWIQEHEAEKQLKEAELAELCGTLPPPFRSYKPLVAEGHAAEQILKAVTAEKIDLVVLGAHGSGAIERLLIGSTSDKVLTQAPCSVLLVRGRRA
ncbi:MAG: universal stress protein [Pirellulales bacterium]